MVSRVYPGVPNLPYPYPMPMLSKDWVGGLPLVALETGPRGNFTPLIYKTPRITKTVQMFVKK